MQPGGRTRGCIESLMLRHSEGDRVETVLHSGQGGSTGWRRIEMIALMPPYVAGAQCSTLWRVAGCFHGVTQWPLGKENEVGSHILN